MQVSIQDIVIIGEHVVRIMQMGSPPNHSKGTTKSDQGQEETRIASVSVHPHGKSPKSHKEEKQETEEEPPEYEYDEVVLGRFDEKKRPLLRGGGLLAHPDSKRRRR